VDSSEGGRKWALTRGIFWSANVGGGLTALMFVIKGGDVMDVLHWWSYMMGALLTLYGGMNVVQKGVVKNDPNPVP